MQQLLDKIAAMKAKVDELEKRSSVFEKDTDSKINNIRSAISIVENIAGNLDKMSTEVETKMKGIEEKARANELRLERKLEQFETNTEKFEKLIKETESKNTKDEMRRDKTSEEVSVSILKEAEDNKNKIKQLALELKEKQDKIEKWLDKSEKQTLATFEEKNKQLVTISTALEEFRRNFDVKQKEMNKIIIKTASDEELASVKAELDRLKEHTATLAPKTEFNEIKRATVGIDKVIEESLSDIREEFGEIKQKMSHFADVEKLNKSFSELKMDVASTESGIQRRFEDLSQKVELLKSDIGASGEFKILAEQDQVLRSKIDAVEKKVKEGLGSTLSGFERLGEVFANKHEFSMTSNEMSNEIKQLQKIIAEIDRRHLELEKQIITREDLKDKATREKAEDALSKVYEHLEGLQAQRQVTDEIREEFQILKEQIILTQNAIVELNAAMHKIASPQIFQQPQPQPAPQYYPYQ